MRGRRRRLLVVAGAIVLCLVLSAPLLAGYLGPRAAAYAQTWRPWRTHLAVEHDPVPGATSDQVMLMVKYTDPWPGIARSPGDQIDFQTVTRVSPLLPWVVTDHATGP